MTRLQWDSQISNPIQWMSSQVWTTDIKNLGYWEGSIAYHADDGKCYINGDPIGYGSRYGSFDVIGMS
jgi:hypothetical protein